MFIRSLIVLVLLLTCASAAPAEGQGNLPLALERPAGQWTGQGTVNNQAVGASLQFEAEFGQVLYTRSR